MLFVCHPKILHKHCLQFLLGEKVKTMLMQNFGVTNKEHYGILWYLSTLAKSKGHVIDYHSTLLGTTGIGPIEKYETANWSLRQGDEEVNKRIKQKNICFVLFFCLLLTWDQALFSFRFENYIPAGKAKRKESQIQTFYETSAAHFFDWLTFAESASQNYFRCLFF